MSIRLQVYKLQSFNEILTIKAGKKEGMGKYIGK